MAKEGAFQGLLEINGVDLSDHCTEFDAPLTRGDVQQNAMGDSDEYGAPGLKGGDITATFIQDFAAAKVHLTLRPLYENGTITSVRWGEVAGNFKYSGAFYVQNYRPIGGAHGEGTLATVTLRRAGNLSTV